MSLPAAPRWMSAQPETNLSCDHERAVLASQPRGAVKIRSKREFFRSQGIAQSAKEAGLEAIVNNSQVSARRETKSHSAQDHWLAERVFDWSEKPCQAMRPGPSAT
jgi:hypothetical protein